MQRVTHAIPASPGARTRRGASTAAGFSMIELLVAVLVVGIGVLGMAIVQGVSVQNNRSALIRADAVALAYDMMDRIRTNPLGDPPGSAFDGLALEDYPPAAANCMTNTCTPAQMVDFDQALWKCQLGRFNERAHCANWRTTGLLPPTANQPGLPDGDGAIEVEHSGMIRVMVEWSDAGRQIRSVVIESQV